MVEYDKKCEYCNNEFKAHRIDTKYCSTNCQRKSAKKRYAFVENKCKDCGAILPPKQRQYCNDCLIKFYHATKSKTAYESLVRRGFGEMLLMESLNRRMKNVK